MAEKKSYKSMKPKVSPQPVVKPVKGMSDKVKLVLVEIDGDKQKIVPEDVVRKPGKTYIYKQEAK